jgi:hypothetical protein
VDVANILHHVYTAADHSRRSNLAAASALLSDDDFQNLLAKWGSVLPLVHYLVDGPEVLHSAGTHALYAPLGRWPGRLGPVSPTALASVHVAPARGLPLGRRHLQMMEW